LKCFALVALIIKGWMCINYIMIKAAILIDRIKVRSQHPQDGVVISLAVGLGFGQKFKPDPRVGVRPGWTDQSS
jgi:hypothetical protein